jgi:hypothetical protein
MSGIGDTLKSVAPALATALGGPLAGAAVSFLSSKLGVDPTLVQQTVAGMTGDQLLKMKELDFQFQEEMGRQGIQLQLAQIDVNKAEAESINWFVAGWRPAVGWTCAVAFAYAYVVTPLLFYLAAIFGTAETVKQVTALPKLELGTMMPVLLGMLGLSWNRTQEKLKDAQGNH